jgi:hypothetical protein
MSGRVKVRIHVRAGGDGQVSGNQHSRLRVKVKSNLRAAGDGNFGGGGRS